MVWASRVGKVPKAHFLAEVIEYLQRAYKVAPSKELMEKLYPFLVEEWRNGATAREAANATCQCKKGEIVPSAPTAIRLAKGEVKPPRGAKAGDIFGAEALRTAARREATAPPAKTPTAKPSRPKPRTTISKPPRAAPKPPPTPSAPVPAPSPVAAEPTQAPAPSADAQKDAMLKAITGAMPDLAKSLAKEMQKEEEGK